MIFILCNCVASYVVSGSAVAATLGIAGVIALGALCGAINAGSAIVLRVTRVGDRVDRLDLAARPFVLLREVKRELKSPHWQALDQKLTVMPLNTMNSELPPPPIPALLMRASRPPS